MSRTWRYVFLTACGCTRDQESTADRPPRRIRVALPAWRKPAIAYVRDNAPPPILRTRDFELYEIIDTDVFYREVVE